MHFWQEHHLNRAAQLLNETRWSVKAVSHEVGFSEPTHFCRRFRAYFGVTPKTYRHRQQRYGGIVAGVHCKP